VILGMALLAALAWVFIDNRWIDVTAPTAVAWLALLVLGGILGVGLSWSLVRARLTGQIEVQ
jgi:hypothetical protein